MKNINKIIYTGASLFLIGGIVLNFLAFYNSPSCKIKRVIKSMEKKESVIFLLNNVNTSCSGSIIYKIINNKKNVDISFYVKQDFTKFEIENLKEAFHLGDRFVIKRMNNEWEDIYQQINKDSEIQLNVLIIYKNGKLTIRRF